MPPPRDLSVSDDDAMEVAMSVESSLPGSGVLDLLKTEGPGGRCELLTIEMPDGSGGSGGSGLYRGGSRVTPRRTTGRAAPIGFSSCSIGLRPPTSWLAAMNGSAAAAVLAPSSIALGGSLAATQTIEKLREQLLNGLGGCQTPS